MCAHLSRSRKSPRNRIINQDEKEEVVKKKLTEFYFELIKLESLLQVHFLMDSILFLGAGVFGHVFQLTARKNIFFSELESLTFALTKEEKHEQFNRLESLKISDLTEVAIRRGDSVAMKCETTFRFNLEHFPIGLAQMPEADAERFSLYKEYNTLCILFNRFGYKEVRGFTRPYAFGKLGDYSFMHSDGNGKTKMFGFHFFIFEMGGPDLEDMMDVCSNNCRKNEQRLSTRTVFLIGDQLISRLQCLHETSIGLTHNDLKCDQLLTGRGENVNTIYLIDFGQVTKYKETWTSTTPVQPLGNRRWAPRSNHQMLARTPLCEIEAACYVLLRLLKNHFPWDGMYDRQIARLQEMRERGENDPLAKTGDFVLYEEKQYLWFYLKKESGRRMHQMADSVEQEIDKYKDFFQERNDKWGDGGSQMLELMMSMAKLGDPLYCGFVTKKIDYSDLNYTALRKHLLGIFDLTMYSHSVGSAGLIGAAKLLAEHFFQENREKKTQRTECGRPVYHYFPEGEDHCFWEWHCRCREFWENRPEYWHKILANRAELADILSRRQMQSKRWTNSDDSDPYPQRVRQSVKDETT